MVYKTFDNYVFGFDMSDVSISYKYYHSLRVMEFCEKIARNLNLSNYDIELAKVIGLYHDIGRFKQWEIYHAFDDKVLDHGDYGEKLLRESRMLEGSLFDDDLEVIYKAVKNHNKLVIRDGLTDRELLFSKIIRDADKLDIIYAMGDSDLRDIEKCDEIVSDGVSKFYFGNKSVPKVYRKNYNDRIVLIFSFIYDINFLESYKIMYENKYYDKIFDRLENKDIFWEYYEHLKKYICERNGLDVSK